MESAYTLRPTTFCSKYPFRPRSGRCGHLLQRTPSLLIMLTYVCSSPHKNRKPLRKRWP